MTKAIISETMKIAIKHAIKLLSDIVVLMQGKQIDTWKNDLDRPVIMEKLTKIVSYFTLIGLFTQYDRLNPIKYLLTEDDEGYVFLYLKNLLPADIQFLEELLDKS